MAMCNPGFYSGTVEANVEVKDMLSTLAGSTIVELSYLEVHCDTPCTMTINNKMPFQFTASNKVFVFPAGLFSVSSIKFNQSVNVTIGFGY